MPLVPQVRCCRNPRPYATTRRWHITCCGGSRDTTPPAMSATKWSTKCEYGDLGHRGCLPGIDTGGSSQYHASTALTPGASPGSYGTNFSWMAIPNCMRIQELSCDLTYYTLDPERRYFSRVRAVSGNRTSQWQRSSSFSPREGRWRAQGQPALGEMRAWGQCLCGFLEGSWSVGWVGMGQSSGWLAAQQHQAVQEL